MAASKIFAYTTTGTKFALGFMACITSIRWVGATTAGHECKIEDANSNVIYDAFATGADFIDSQRYEKMPMVNGIVVTTLSSGTVYIEVD